MKNLKNSFIWRDRLLLLICWILIIFAALNYWATQTSDQHSLFLMQFQDWLQNTFYDTSVLLFFLVIVLPFTIFLITRFNRFQYVTTILNKYFLDARTYSFLLFCFALIQALFLLSKSFRHDPISVFLQISVISIILMRVFYRRASIDLHSVILTVTWLLLIIIIRLNSRELLGRIGFLDTSWRARLLLAFYAISFVFLSSLPLLWIHSRIRPHLSNALIHITKISLKIIGVLFLSSLIFLIAMYQIQFVRRVHFIIKAISGVNLIVLVLSLSGLTLKLTSKDISKADKPFPKLSTRWFRVSLFLIALVFGLLALRIGFNMQEQISPDSLVYMIIGRDYAEGHAVVRGCWSPLVSWLMTPFIAIRLDPQICLRLLGGLAGIAWIFLADLQALRVGLSRYSRLALAVSMALLTLTNAFTTATPDLLGAIFIAVYFLLVLHPSFIKHPLPLGALCGLIGALAYYGKYYNSAFFLIHILLTGILLRVHGRQARAVNIAVVSSLVSFAIFALPWIIALSVRYGEFTISTSSSINHAIVGPGSEGHLCWKKGLCDQPRDVLIPWEDPLPQYYPMLHWSPFESSENFRYLIRLVKENLIDWTSNTMSPIGPFPILSILTFGGASLVFWSKSERRLFYSWNLLTVLTYISGYLLTKTEDFRYFVAIAPILLIALYHVLESMAKKLYIKLPERHGNLASIFLVTLLILSIFRQEGIRSTITLLNTKPDPCLRQSSQDIAEYLVEPIAGTDRNINFIAYYNRIRTYGVVPLDTIASEANSSLRTMHVKTFIVPTGTELAEALISDHGYSLATRNYICDMSYSILHVPD
jgi:hypothetical protein